MIANAYNDSRADTDLWPGIYFFDSLKAHRMGQVAGDVRRWLNAECKRLFDSASGTLTGGMIDLLSAKDDYEQACKSYPFMKRTMEVTSPKGKLPALVIVASGFFARTCILTRQGSALSR
jgi:hypothetical protein